RPLGQGFCRLIKKSESSIVEGVEQFLDEVNGYLAAELKEVRHAGVGNNIMPEDDSLPGFSGLPAGQFDPRSNMASEYGRESVSKAKPSNTGLANEINRNLDAAEALITTSETDPFGFNQQRASEAKGYLDKAADGYKKLLDKAQRSEFQDRHLSMGTRLQTIEGQRGEFIGKEVEERFINKAKTAIDLFSSPVKVEEVKEVEELLEQARNKIKEELIGNNYTTIREGLISQYKELNQKLQRYKIDLLKKRIDPLKKEFDDYWEEYGRISTMLELQVLECSESDPGEQRIGKVNELRNFYDDSLKTAQEKKKKFAGKPAYGKELLILNHNIDHMRTQIFELDKRLKKELKGEPADCNLS
ncbi:hypothetical protein, partial [Endozoicomonas sp. ONNA2]|uniref:hypothetical protein n=1 Tax=Endozoicomonas sp. ONNA2 TaxID=2828741 RepID=UPI002148F4F4